MSSTSPPRPPNPSSSSVPRSPDTIPLTVTDMRTSTYYKQPPSQWVQTDVQIQFPLHQNDQRTSFPQLLEAIVDHLHVTNAFELADTDMKRLDWTMLDQLSNNDSLVLLDSGQVEFPVPYKGTFIATPHVRAMTSQEGKFYGSEHHNRAAFAIAELIDNSLSATSHMNHDTTGGRRVIEVRFYDAGKASSFAVLDNGCGMNGDTLNASLRLKVPKEERQQGEEEEAQMQSSDDEEAIFPMYINSNISKFGAGMKQAVFWLGGQTTILTKTKFTPCVREVILCKAEMEEKEKSAPKGTQSSAWHMPIVTGTLGQVRQTQEPNPILRTIIEAEEGTKPSFTHIFIERLDEERILYLRRKDSEESPGPSIERQLAHIYHYYLHGRNGNTGDRADTGLDIIVSRHKGNEVSSTNLRDMPVDFLDLESLSVQSATPQPYMFTLEAREFNSTTNVTIGGIIRYHPFLFNHETKPVFPQPKPFVSDNNAEMPENTTQVSSSSNQLFQVWWNGRLIPHTRLEAFNWCSPGLRMKDTDPLSKSHGRVSGSLFLNGEIAEITENKLDLTTTTRIYELFDFSKFHEQQCRFQRVVKRPDGGLNRRGARIAAQMGRSNNKMEHLKKDYEAWLTECQKWDKEVHYSKLQKYSDGTPVETKLETKAGSSRCYQYGSARWDKFVLKIGDAVKLVGSRNAVPILGRVKCFYVKETSGPPHDLAFAPESQFLLELKPAPYYAESLDTLPMRIIDKQVSPAEAQRYIQKQLDELQMKLEVHITPSDFRDGVAIPINGTLFSFVKVDVKKITDNSSVEGSLQLYKSKRSNAKKNVLLHARIYRIHESGKWEVYHTSDKCVYMKNNAGFCFKKLPLSSIEGIEVGNYVLTFLSYVDANPESGGEVSSLTSVPASSSSPRKSRRTKSLGPPNANATTAEEVPSGGIDWAVEHWKKDVDSLGRKILRDGDTEIRMPFGQIKFSIVPGPPKKFDIEELDDCESPQRIGKPFNLTLSLTDAKGNPTTPEDGWAWLAFQKPKVAFLTTGSIVPNLNQVTTRVSENQLVIQNIVAEGHFGGDQYKDATVEIEIEMTKGDFVKRRSPYKIRFEPGPPASLLCSPDTVTVQNGETPCLQCLVRDSSGNLIVKQTENDKKKPILLNCAIHQGITTDDGNSWVEGDLVLSTTILATKDGAMFMDDKIVLSELQPDPTSSGGPIAPVTLLCKIFYDKFPEIPAANVFITVTPSDKPAVVKLYRLHDNEQTPEEVAPESEVIQQIGDRISLFFKLFDGSGKEVPFEGGKHEVKCGWTKERIRQASLPIYKVPTRTEHRKEFTTTIRLRSTNVDVSHTFYVTSKPGEVARLQAVFDGGKKDTTDLPLGTPTPDILVKLIDVHGNDITSQEDNHRLEADVDIAVDECYSKFEIDTDPHPEYSFIIRNLKVHISKTPTVPLPLGDVQMTLTYRQSFPTNLTLRVIPGPPSTLAFEINGATLDPNEIVTVGNNSTLRILAGFLDVGGNRTQAPEDTKITFSRIPREVTLSEEIPTQTSCLRKGETRTDFGTITLGIIPTSSASSKVGQCGAKSCTVQCFGKPIAAQIQATMDGKTVSEKLQFHLTARPDIPAFLVPSNNGPTGDFCYKAGSTFDHLAVTLEAEDGQPYKTAEKEHLYLVLHLGLIPSQIQASHVQDGVYTFDKVPTVAGVYQTEFVYNNPGHNVRSTQLFDTLKVLPDRMASLQPGIEFTNLIVANDPANPKNREIIPATTFFLKDSHGNPMEVSGIQNEIPGGSLRLTLSQGVVLESHQVSFPVTNGKVDLTPLRVKAGLNLVNNSKHTVTFVATLEGGSVFDYRLDFTFVNNVEVQQKIQGHQSTLQQLTLEIDDKQHHLAVVQEELSRLQVEHRTLLGRTEALKTAVGPEIGQTLTSSRDVGRQEEVLKTKEKRMSRETGNRKSNIQPGPWENEADVFGPIGLLADVNSEDGGKDANIQYVLSWHLQKKLGVVVTRTEEKGLELLEKHPNNQFMLLDITKEKGLSFENLRSYSTVGNPVYAKELLKPSTKCPDAFVFNKVFNTILGNTIVMDDLKSATSFMKVYNARAGRWTCPTILTLDGQKLQSDGIIGGTGNRIPNDRRQLMKFGITPPKELIKIQEEMIAFAKLKAAMIDFEEFNSNNEERKNVLQSTAAGIETQIHKCVLDRDGIRKELDALQLENTGNHNGQGVSAPPRSSSRVRTRISNPPEATPPVAKRPRRSNM